MPLHHYLPASFLARFSPDSKEVPTRDRFLVIGDKKTKKIFKASAGKVGCINNLYTLFDSPSDPNMVDQTWTGYEQKLPAAIEELIRGGVNAYTWLRVLVPFVACMLIRGPDFVDKYYERLDFLDAETLEKVVSNDVANQARLIDLQRLLGFVATAKWVVFSGTETLITNDLGYAPFYNPISREHGMAIPLDSHNILVVIPFLEDHPILRAEQNSWMPIIHYALPSTQREASEDQLNKGVADMALRFIIGADEEGVKKYLAGASESSVSIDTTDFGFPSGKFARAHEFTWHRLVTAISGPPSEDGDWDFSMDINVIVSGWHSMPFIPMNLIEFPPALKKVKGVIWSSFYDPEIYYQISRLRELEKAGRLNVVVQEATSILSTKLSALNKARILSIRGLALADIGKKREAIKDFQKAIRLDSSNAILHADFGYVLLKGNLFPQAYKIISRAIQIDPNLGIAYSNRCVALWKMGRLKPAVEDATTALELLHDGIEKAGTFRNRGYILKQLGLEAQANEDFLQVEKLIKEFAPNKGNKTE